MTPARFDLGCSPVVFDLDAYPILTRRGYRLQALLAGMAVPRDLDERYFVRCIREDADYDSHQCLEAEVWRQLLERREFERLNPPPAAGQTWVRLHELQPGVILPSHDGGPILFTQGLGVEYRGVRHNPYLEYRLAPQFPWRRGHDGYFRQVLNLTTNAIQEFPMPSIHRKNSRAKSFEDYRGSRTRIPDWQRIVTALDEPPREMLYVWQRTGDDEMVIADVDTGETFHVPPNQVAHNATWRVRPYELLRVQFWAGQPVWVWGPA